MKTRSALRGWDLIAEPVVLLARLTLTGMSLRFAKAMVYPKLTHQLVMSFADERMAFPQFLISDSQAC